jgi:hypothetical protein
MPSPLRKEMALPELLSVTVESLNSDAAYLRIMSLGRSEQEMILLNRLAAKIDKLGVRLGRMLRPGAD